MGIVIKMKSENNYISSSKINWKDQVIKMKSENNQEDTFCLADKVFVGRHHTPKNLFVDSKELVPLEDVKRAVKELKSCFGYKLFTREPHHYTTDKIFEEIDKIFGSFGEC